MDLSELAELADQAGVGYHDLTEEKLRAKLLSESL